ncbi:lipopolysaccharide assembly protein LapA domain-containing protein [Phaeobacter sp. PT47_59]|uniref:lipopolysaccharide assembly protein LapA domain-containing protein n=1 Tax=Phaeobacter sp. PT47_59 TaxID=3029979 RepID=UPI0023809512|nr:lipopolysaccharide assembly protein LapA domain-containing protein [Phaeobacter sp. PT47_59]MDE4175323.1 lipopolysaccharide assembly protein LapA domain-containing protein [Phaeobacter sp. PT47_59]
MRYLRYAILGALGIVLISVCLANRSVVELKLMPTALAELVGWNPTIALPLFVVVLGGVAVGVVVGFIWEWLREHKHRREAGQHSREVKKLSREVQKLKKQKHEGKDEVLALLDDAV